MYVPTPNNILTNTMKIEIEIIFIKERVYGIRIFIFHRTELCFE